jgi:hypothetical protein
MEDISQEARQLLADAYMARKMPWFYHDIMSGKGCMFDTPLRVLTKLLQDRPLN